MITKIPKKHLKCPVCKNTKNIQKWITYGVTEYMEISKAGKVNINKEYVLNEINNGEQSEGLFCPECECHFDEKEWC